MSDSINTRPYRGLALVPSRAQSNPASGSPRKFATMQEVHEYLAGDLIECLICGRHLRFLQHRHLRSHGIDSDQYREMFGIPWTYSLTGTAFRKRAVEAMTPDRVAMFRRYMINAGNGGKLYRKLCPAALNQLATNVNNASNA